MYTYKQREHLAMNIITAARMLSLFQMAFGFDMTPGVSMRGIALAHTVYLLKEFPDQFSL